MQTNNDHNMLINSSKNATINWYQMIIIKKLLSLYIIGSLFRQIIEFDDNLCYSHRLEQ